MDIISESWLTNKVAVVTGGNSGIGAATVRALAAHGAETVIMDIATRETVPGIFIHTDVTQADQVNNAKDEIIKIYGRVDIFINSAGVNGVSFLTEMSLDEWHRVIQINLYGTFLCCRAFASVMLEQGSGIIINVASDRGIYGVANTPHYAASKGGVIALTKSLAKEVKSRGVRVYAVNPGSTRTPLWEGIHTEEERKQALASGKTGDPADIAGMVLLLTRPESACLTGLVLSREQLKD